MKKILSLNRKSARRVVTALLLAAALLLSGCAGVPTLPEAKPETPQGDSAVLDEKLDALRALAPPLARSRRIPTPSCLRISAAPSVCAARRVTPRRRRRSPRPARR